MGLLSILKSKRKRYTQEALRDFAKINKKYQLGLHERDYIYIAQALGKAKANAKKSFLKGLNFFDVVFVGISLFNGHLFLAGGGVGFKYKKHTQNQKINDLRLKTFLLNQKTQALRNFNPLKNKSFLKNINTYANYADGGVYKDGAPGSETFKATQPYDVTKGLRNDFKISEIDEMINNRAHYTAAGNEGFIDAIFEGFILESNGGVDVREIQSALLQNAENNYERIYKGFVELVGKGFNILNTADKHFQELINKDVKSFLSYINSLEFIEKNKNYNKALRLEIFVNLNKWTQDEQINAEDNFKNQARFQKKIDTLMLEWEKTDEKLNQLKKELKKILKEAEGESDGRDFRDELLLQNSFINGHLDDKRKALINELYKSEKALLNDVYYVQKSQLYTQAEKKKNYKYLIETFMDVFTAKIGRLIYCESDLGNNAIIQGWLFNYNTNLAWINENSKTLDELYAKLYPNDNDEDLIDFYETHILNGFVEGEFINKEPFNAFFIRLDNKPYIKIIKGDISFLKKRIYKGF